jgi:ribonuclease BN (tRNA processing enzyme)
MVAGGGGSVQITVLGKSPAWQDAGGACSGYLVRHAGAKVLLDCGNGVFSKLRKYLDYTELDAVVISHLHADHILDLVPYSYALTYAPRQQPVPIHRWPGTQQPARPMLYAPPGSIEVFRKLTGSWGHERLIEHAFEVREYDPDLPLPIGKARLRFHKVPHYVPTYAVEVAGEDGGGRLTFGADCSPTDELVSFATGTDLLLIEATLPRPERGGVRGHLTPAEAGEHGRRAGARRLVITHISDELDALWARSEATRTFGRPVHLAREGDSFVV